MVTEYHANERLKEVPEEAVDQFWSSFDEDMMKKGKGER